MRLPLTRAIRHCNDESDDRYKDHRESPRIEDMTMATKLLPPVHPGEILREEFLLPFELTSTALAQAIGVTAARINEIVNERRGITADTALRLARYFGTTADMWLNLQKRYELETARREIGDVLESIHPRAA